MRKLTISTVAILFLWGCGQDISKNQLSDKSIKVTINTILDNWHNNAAEANFNEFMNAMGSQSVYIGTDASEIWTKQQFMEFCQPYFDKSKAWSFKSTQRNIYISQDKNVVWFDELLDT